MNRQKDVQYSSRAASHIKRQRQIHKLRHIITELSLMIPEDRARNADVRSLAAYGCPTRMHVIRLLAPVLDYEDHSKDVDFSPSGIRQRWQAGYDHTLRTLDRTPWREDVDPLEGFVLHEAMGGEMVHTPAAD